MGNKAFIFLADGFEEVEAMAPADILRRGGVDVELVSISEDPFVTSSHGVSFGVDSTLESGIDIENDDIMIFPGGMPGTKNLAACAPLMDAMKDHYAEGGLVAAICAAPGYVVGQIDSLEGVEFTCYDGCEDLAVSKGGIFVKRPAVSCGNLITGRCPGHAIEFALEILKKVRGEDVKEKVSKGFTLVCE